MSRPFALIFLCAALATAAVDVSLWRATAGRPAAPRIPTGPALVGAFVDAVCRPPSDAETLDWLSRPFDKAAFERAVGATREAQRVRQIRSLYRDRLRRDPNSGDCAQVRDWLDRDLSIDEAGRRLAGLPEARRVEQMRQAFTGTLGWDPLAWDDEELRRWVDGPFTIAEIRSRLLARRPLIGVHYFLWYRPDPGGWRNDLTTVPAASPRPALGQYDSGDTDVMAAQIKQMEDAGFDFVIVHVIAQSPRTWANARTFIDRLSGHRLKAAVLLDGLYDEQPAAKAAWVRKTAAEFAGDDHYLRLGGAPLIMLFSALLDFDVPGVRLRNVYWTDRYDPGRNTFNPDHRLDSRDWPFWAATPQPVVNDIVAVVPGYVDAGLGRARTMEHPRRDGQLYREQWQRALALRPKLILVYSWNEYFERTAIEPTDAWGTQYLEMTACFARHAHRGTRGEC